MAPRLDRKIKSVRAGVMGNDDFAYEAIDLLAKAKPVKSVTAADLRDGSDTDDDTEGFDADAAIEDSQAEFKLDED